VTASWLAGRAAIVGIGRTAYGTRGEFAARGTLALAAEAIANACADAGISPVDVDGYSSFADDSATPDLLYTAFGAKRLRYTGMTWSGGGSAIGGAFLHAAMAVATGQAEAVVVHRSICQGEGGRFGRLPIQNGFSPEISFVGPYGLLAPAHFMALAARRHMYRYGTTIDHFAEVAMNARLMAAANPDARFREPITIEEHHASRPIADPLRLLDCCMESDVAGAIVIVAAERAADLPQPPVFVQAAVVGGSYRYGSGMVSNHNMPDDDFASAGQRGIARELWRLSGLSPADVDVAMLYDHFTPMVVMGLEDFGFCGIGEGGPFVAAGNLRVGGALPTNTHGGNLAEVYAHGITHYLEAVRQLRGTSSTQIGGAEVVLVAGGGGSAATSAVLLGRSPR
jgi:acetyl-CoA acetyltransferase